MVVTHNVQGHQQLSGILGEVLTYACSFINAFLPSFQRRLQKVPVLLSLSMTVFGSYWLTLAVRNTLKCSLKESTGWSVILFKNLSNAFLLVSTNSSEKRSTTPFTTNFSGRGCQRQAKCTRFKRPKTCFCYLETYKAIKLQS